jgi:ketosteroid isomerase-like protein
MKSQILFLLLIASPLYSQEPDSSSAILEMREAERNFARASVMVGRNAAFVQNFADKSVLFTDKWITNGKQFLKELKPSPVVLKWEPEFMDIDPGLDFGYSTGPWERQEYRPNTDPLATGYFLTVWEKSPEGLWQVILDAGASTPVMRSKKHDFSFPPGADKLLKNSKKVDNEPVCKALVARDLEFLRQLKGSSGKSAFDSFVAPGARILKNGHLPTTNPDTLKIWVSEVSKTLNRTPAGSGASHSGDMGFTYGVLKTKDSREEIKGHYVSIWKKQPDGQFRIVMEMLNPD